MRHVDDRTQSADNHGTGGASKVDAPPLSTEDGCYDDLLHAVKLTVPQAAKMLGIGATNMRAIIGSGRIPVVRIMGKTLLLEQDLEGYLRSSYGRIVKVKSDAGRLPPLPKRVIESKLIKKAS